MDRLEGRQCCWRMNQGMDDNIRKGRLCRERDQDICTTLGRGSREISWTWTTGEGKVAKEMDLDLDDRRSEGKQGGGS